jgi:hypothetical protein
MPKYPTALSKRNAYISKDSQDLLAANAKLKEDNIKLFT